MVSIEGIRLRLRDFELRDLSAYEFWLQPQHAWHKFDGPYFPSESKEETEKRLVAIRERIKSKRFSDPRSRLVIADRGSDTLLGTVSCYWLSEETNWLAAGISVFDQENWGRGLGYEALGLWCQYLLESYPQLVRLDLQTWSGNLGMMRLAQKLGFREEARFRKARIVDGAYYDGLGYGILREEWAELYPAGFARHLSNMKGMV